MLNFLKNCPYVVNISKEADINKLEEELGKKENQEIYFNKEKLQMKVANLKPPKGKQKGVKKANIQALS